MKRIVVLIDGTWNKEGTGDDTNVAKLHAGQKVITRYFIKARAANGTIQNARYHDGVGTEGDLLAKLLGGAIGIGLKKIIRECYQFVVKDYENGDEIYIIGFSRGAYAARALAGLIGASGIQRRSQPDLFEIAWQHYRVKPMARRQLQNASSTEQKSIREYETAAARDGFHDTRNIKAVAVWDTVGSYGIPAGFGLAPLARYFTLAVLGFHDTSFGDHIEVGLHAVAVDEHRRSFVPTFWTTAKGKQPKGHVEQTWFVGAHCNVGGGYSDSGLSDQALIWMIARLQALTGLEFDLQAVRSNTQPSIDSPVIDSTVGWPVDHYLPHYRKVLSPVAVHHGWLTNSEDLNEEHINERLHWSILAKRGSRAGSPYHPPNLPSLVSTDKVAAITKEEELLLHSDSN